MDDDKKSLDTVWEEAKPAYEAENDAWWNALSEKEREDAFYAVVKRIYVGEVVVKGSYRYVLYEVFGFDYSMYGRGMDCGYLALHNLIMSDEEQRIIQDHYKNKQIDKKCPNIDASGNCNLHNLHCQYPECSQ